MNVYLALERRMWQIAVLAKLLELLASENRLWELSRREAVEDDVGDEGKRRLLRLRS